MQVAGDGRKEAGVSKSRIDTEAIAAAERLLGLAWTAAERAQMARTLGEQTGAAGAARACRLPNDAPGALRFDPRLPGFAMPEGPDLLRLSGGDAPPLPADPADIAFAPVQTLSRWIAAGSLSSLALTRLYLDRARATDPSLHAWATLTPERALAEAAAADRLLAEGRWLGPLHGIPYGLKDLFDTAGIRTAWGAEPFRGRVPDTDAAVVARLAAAGAVLMGKTAVGALADGDVWYGGQTRNPWNPAEGSSGSSAGSAAAVAAGACAFAIGTETLGSITAPSERCGVTGLRPTHGRVSRAGCMALSPSLDKVGPLCRRVEDAAMVLAALNGFDLADAGSIAAPFRFDADLPVAGLRLGLLGDGSGPAVARADKAAADAGMELVRITLPDLPYMSLLNLMHAEAAAALEALTLDDLDDMLARQDDAAWPNTLRQAWFLSAVDHVRLDRLRYRVMVALDAIFATVDAVIGPPQGPMLVASNFSGHPCLQLPACLAELPARTGTWTSPEPEPAPDPAGPKATVPLGVSLWGRLFDEGRLLSIGLALERGLGVADARPGPVS